MEERSLGRVKIKIRDDHGLDVIGDVDVLDGEGKKIFDAGEVILCRCGLSNQKPLCDSMCRGKFFNKIRKDTYNKCRESE